MTVDESVDATIINESLQKVAKGAGLVFLGTVIGTILGFVERVLIARYYTQAQYGVFSLALVLLNIFAVIATLGLQEGVARQIAYYRGKEDDKKVRGIIISSIEIALIASIILSFILFFSSNFISTKVFHESLLSPVIKIFSITLPFFVLINIFVAIVRGFNDVKPQVYFQSILRNVLFLSLLIVILWLSLSFLEVIYVFSLSIIISCFLLVIYVIKKFAFLIKKDRPYRALIKKELLLFSLPLMISGVLYYLMSWTDTLMLGYYKSSEVVGLYNTASPLARLIPIFLVSARYLYIPVVSQLYAYGNLKDVGRIYQIITKWIFLITLPLFGFMFIFPQTTIQLLFGSKYAASALTLRILAFGFMFHALLGPNGESLIVIGDSKFVMISNIASAILNVLLNLILIPVYGIEGAAISTAASYIIANTLKSLRLYKKTDIHPFMWNYIKPITISFLLLGSIRGLNIKVPSVWHTIPILILFLVIYSLLLLLSKSLDKEDISLLLAVEKKLGIDFGVVRKVLEKVV